MSLYTRSVVEDIWILLKQSKSSNNKCVTISCWKIICTLLGLQDLIYLIQSNNVSKTILTGFLNFYCRNPKAKKHLYQGNGWKSKDRYWFERINGNYCKSKSVIPTKGKRYYLRTLLNHVPSSSLYENLLTVNGTKFFTFKQAIQKTGLLESNNYKYEDTRAL